MAHRIGIDAVSFERVGKLSTSFINHYYSQSEIIEYNKLNNNATKLEFLASRYAAKEALLKALGTGLKGFALNEISLNKKENGEPYLQLSGNVLAYLDENFKKAKIEVSITHESPLAIAIVSLDFGDTNE